MIDLAVPALEIVLRTVIVYVALFVLLRLAGKRELGQMSLSDLLVILVIANAVQSSLLGGDVSLVGGLIAAATLVTVNLIVDRLGTRSALFARLVLDEPTLLLHDGVPIEAHLRREHVTLRDIEMSAREHGIADLSDVSAAILEPDGAISIIPRDATRVHRTRLLRQLKQF